MCRPAGGDPQLALWHLLVVEGKNIIGKTWGVILPAHSDSQLAHQYLSVVECKVVEKNIIGKTLGYQTPSRLEICQKNLHD